MIYPEKPCRNCRHRFNPTRRNQEFCSAACRVSFYQYGSINAGKIERIATKLMRAKLKEFETRLAALETAAGAQ